MRPWSLAASMRPPQNAGESRIPQPMTPARSACFNEAPAERGGKSASPGDSRRSRCRFNEAPAERGGK